MSLIVLLFLLLFSISCKSKQEPTEAVIPQEYSGKYILSYGDGNYNSDFYYKTTSSNCIISSEKYNNGTRSYHTTPIFLYSIDSNDYSYEYHQDTKAPYYSIYVFFTNGQSQREITLTQTGTYDLWWIYIHEDDINK